LTCVQWIQGAGQPLPSHWLPLLQRIQAAGKSVQLFYAGSHGGDADYAAELDALCSNLDRTKLFIVMDARSVEEAEALVKQVS
jgi:predicted ferric reductase